MLEAWTRKRDVRDANGEPTGERESAIERLFNRLSGTYLGKWTHNFKDAAAIKNWASIWSERFVKEGVTPQIAAVAIDRCEREGQGWGAPTLPEFLALCLPVIDYEELFHEAVRQMVKRQYNNPAEPDVWPYPALYWAAVDFGGEMRMVSYSPSVATRWKRLLDKRLQGECEQVPNFALQLAAPPRNADGVAITSEQAKAEARAAFRALLNRKPSSEVAATKAREVLARHEAGESVLPYLLSHAREVLANLAGPATAPDDENI